MRRFNLLVLLTIFAFATTACADSPESPVPGKSIDDPTNTASGNSEEAPITAMALRYKGLGPADQVCDLYLALEEEAEEEKETSSSESHNHDHAEHMLIKFDYATSDGHRPHAGEGQFYQVDNSNFVDVDPEIPGAAINFIAKEFTKAAKAEGLTDVENIAQMQNYIRNNKFEQFFRVRFASSLDFHEYEEALEAVLADPSTFDQHKSTLDTIRRATLTMLHNGDHSHSDGCTFSDDQGTLGLVEVVETEFDMEAHEH